MTRDDRKVWPGVDQKWVREWPGMNQGLQGYQGVARRNQGVTRDPQEVKRGNAFYRASGADRHA